MPSSAASAPRIEPVQLVLAHELVLEQIRTALALGRFRAGRDPAAGAGPGRDARCLRPPVREALAVLAAEGVIEIRRGRNGGLFVTGRPARRRGKLKLLRENRERLRETFEYRVIVESAAASYAARAAHPGRTDRPARHGRGDAAAERPAAPSITTRSCSGEFFAVDNDFHTGIARASRNDWLEKATLSARIEMFRPSARSSSGWSRRPTTCTSRSSPRSRTRTPRTPAGGWPSTSRRPGPASSPGCSPRPAPGAPEAARPGARGRQHP